MLLQYKYDCLHFDWLGKESYIAYKFLQKSNDMKNFDQVFAYKFLQKSKRKYQMKIYIIMNLMLFFLKRGT
jgi:hypothetical protein